MPTFADLGVEKIGFPITSMMDQLGHDQDQQHGIGQHAFYAHHGYMMEAYGEQMMMHQHHQMHSLSGGGEG